MVKECKIYQNKGSSPLRFGQSICLEGGGVGDLALYEYLLRG